MRPLLLHMQGFGVYRDPIDIDFEGVDYFALVGPTGAGKSTVIDAICFALYGSVPRYGDERLTARVVSAGLLETKVSLTFSVGDARFRVTRVVRVRNGKASTPEAILEALGPGDESHMLAGSARELKEAVHALLGLPFADFTKSVVLPQGEFARFLQDEPAKRRDLLTRLLDLQVYDTVGQLARQRAAAARQAIDIHERQRAELAHANDEAREAAQQRREALLELHRALDAARPADEELAAAAASADVRAEAAVAAARRLGHVSVPAELADLAAALEASAAELRAATDASAAAAAALAALDAEVAALPDRRPRERALEAHAAAASLREELNAAQAQEAAAHLDAARVEELGASADARLADAQAAFDALRDQHAAHALRAHLVAGQPCPVCEQPVTAVPKRTRLATLRKAESARAEAGALVDEARHAASVATRAVADAQARTRQVAQRLTDLDAQLCTHPDIDALTADLERIDELIRAHTEARNLDTAQRRATRVAEARKASLDTSATEAWTTYRELRDEFVRVGLTPPAADNDLPTTWSALHAWAEQEAARQDAEAEAARAAANRARTAQADALTAHVRRARDLGVQDDAPDLAAPDLGGLRDAVLQHGRDARNELQRIDDAIERARKLDAEIAAAREEHDVAELLGSRLRSDRFERWLLVEALDVLVAAASGTLFALSAGQYSLRSTAEDEFVVVDHRNADELRSIRTLSGGETFQASLALALALSDRLAELSSAGQVKLEAIFLDEGFGTLDADTLESVAATIETLGTSGRMVGIVTHVPALAERVPVRYRVARNGRGARVDREDA